MMACSRLAELVHTTDSFSKMGKTRRISSACSPDHHKSLEEFLTQML